MPRAAWTVGSEVSSGPREQGGFMDFPWAGLSGPKPAPVSETEAEALRSLHNLFVPTTASSQFNKFLKRE
ncbi:hypothetical protein [Streptomyces sp. RKAG293]|uniref:hypothetical protein n=1 Tax=Streptomyces sp. RKAG293 TaxID=2893403 RepID=UPI0020348F8D|nr:hypothetical protein [Streptomyces sp. RKAG293]MCM2417174.1 hypothetical protein [Streptomyces sp. RKAG293]